MESGEKFEGKINEGNTLFKRRSEKSINLRSKRIENGDKKGEHRLPSVNEVPIKIYATAAAAPRRRHGGPRSRRGGSGGGGGGGGGSGISFGVCGKGGGV